MGIFACFYRDNTFPEKMNSTSHKRIEYIDAMRGFTMFLVVQMHVTVFGLGLMGSDTFSYTSLFSEFRMPLFFFISGFVFYKAHLRWNLMETISFLKKKVSVQLLSPFLFMASLEIAKEGSIVNALFDYAKAGYWFTFALFEYFCFYILFQQFVRLFRLKGLFEDLFLLTLGGVIYIVTIYTNVIEYEWDKGWPALIGISTWHNFLFFVIGTRIRKYFSAFERWLDTKYAVAFVVSIYIMVNILPYVKDLSSTLFNLVTATTGILLVFALFRHHQDFFATHRIGKTMQFVGRRTLDIYLIHYFFLWSNMQAVLPNFGELNSPFLEFICSSTIALLIMACCLGVSCVLRLSPVMAHFLFGEKLRF